MSPEVIVFEHEPESPAPPPDLQSIATEVAKLRRQIDGLFGTDTNLSELFYEKLLPLIHEAEERKIG